MHVSRTVVGALFIVCLTNSGCWHSYDTSGALEVNGFSHDADMSVFYYKGDEDVSVFVRYGQQEIRVDLPRHDTGTLVDDRCRFSPWDEADCYGHCTINVSRNDWKKGDRIRRLEGVIEGHFPCTELEDVGPYTVDATFVVSG